MAQASVCHFQTELLFFSLQFSSSTFQSNIFIKFWVVFFLTETKQFKILLSGNVFISISFSFLISDQWPVL
jgi:hypothetical protein